MSDEKRTQADLEKTFRDVTDPGYALPLEQDAPSWDLVAGAASVLARSSAAVETNSQGFFLLPSSRQTAPSASGAVLATATVRARRVPGAAAVAVLIPAGKRVVPTLKDSRGQPAVLEEYVLASDVLFPEGELGPIDVLAQATRPGEQANLRQADSVALGLEGTRTVKLASIAGYLLTDTGLPDVFTASDVGRYLLLAGEAVPRRVSAFSQDSQGRGQVRVEGGSITGTSPARLLEWAELGVTLEQITPWTGGRHATLDQIGAERGMPRGPGEGDLDYAYRVSELPDVVSPAAIDRTVARILSPLGIPYEIHEVTEPGLQGFVLDQSPLDAGAVCDPAWPWTGVVLFTAGTCRRFFLICIQPNQNLGRYGLFFDCANAGINFYDCAEEGGDGGALTYDNAIAVLQNAINTARMAGVAWRLVAQTAFVPLTFRTVTLIVTLASGAGPYLAARDAALAAYFQLLEPGESTTGPSIAEAVSNALLVAGLDPSAIVTSLDSLVPAGPREKLEYTI